MALTEIAKKLKETFSGFEVSGFQEELNKFRALYKEAECIRIGDMNYIVINDVYKSEEYQDIPESTSPLFYKSINNRYAIIDTETSSTLIDEVYTRITYMQRDCEVGARLPSSDEIKTCLDMLIGEGETILATQIEDNETEDGSLSKNRANIFQCQLIKDTGVSASPDVYSFMLKDGKIKEIADSAIKMIKDAGVLRMLDDSNLEEIKSYESSIQEAVFNKYINSDIDIQSVNVKSIFEIKMAYCNINLLLQSKLGNTKINSVFNTSYLTSENDEFNLLNGNIHVCNSCNHDLVDVRDQHKIYKLHANLDAYDERLTLEAIANAKKKVTPKTIMDHIVYVSGCEDCLEQCPDCGGWHFNYSKLVGNSAYDKLKLAPGRGFIRAIRDFDINYCSCREGIEWVYDECSGSEGEYDVIPMKELAFFNFANEKLRDYNDYIVFYEKERKKARDLSGVSEKEFAKQTLNRYKNIIANEFNISVSSIKISSILQCNECCICGGQYYGRLNNGRCAICSELFDENKHMVTRTDGIVFMVRNTKKAKEIRRYVVTKFGNLKLIGVPRIIKKRKSSSLGDDVLQESPLDNTSITGTEAIEQYDVTTDTQETATTVSEFKE